MKRRMCLRTALLVVAIIVCASWKVTPASAQTMVGLGFLPGSVNPYSVATCVSADGSTIAGQTSNADGGYEAFIWTAEIGLVGLGTLPGRPYSIAYSVSADGSTLVGSSYDGHGSEEAFVWTSATGMIGLGTLPGAQEIYSVADDVSADGKTVVGFSASQGNLEAFVWSAETGMVGLGNHPGGYSAATGVSADGSTVVGWRDSQQEFTEAYIWTAATGMIGLGVPEALDWSVAWDVSADGSTIVGQAVGESVVAFIWTAETGMFAFGSLFADSSSSWALGVSSDGTTVVGSRRNWQGEDEGFVWTESGVIGVGYLPGAVARFSDAWNVSADGSTVVGQSMNAQGQVEAYVLRLQSDPTDLIADLIDQIAALNLKHGIESSLDAKLDAALDALEDAAARNDVAAVNSLNTFINAVIAQRGKAISSADADALIAAARNIIQLLT